MAGSDDLYSLYNENYISLIRRILRIKLSIYGEKMRLALFLDEIGIATRQWSHGLFSSTEKSHGCFQQVLL